MFLRATIGSREVSRKNTVAMDSERSSNDIFIGISMANGRATFS